MAYCTIEDILERFEEEELIQLTQDDPNKESIDDTVIQRAIDDAEAIINGYCEKWYSIPITPATNLIKKLCIDIAVYNIYSRRTQFTPPQVVTERYENAMKLLNDIAMQKILLGVESSTSVKTAGSGGVFHANDRIFKRDTLEDF